MCSCSSGLPRQWFLTSLALRNGALTKFPCGWTVEEQRQAREAAEVRSAGIFRHNYRESLTKRRLEDGYLKVGGLPVIVIALVAFCASCTC